MLNLNELPKVDLNPELVLIPGPFGQQIEHPLVKEVMYVPDFNHIYNEQLRLRKEKCQEALQARNWHGYIGWHERAYRLNALLEVHRNMSDQEYWEAVREYWVDSENIWQNQKAWEELLLSHRPNEHLFMTKEEKEYLDSLPEVITIHRGYRKTPKGFSYSLSKTKATWFANRFGKNGKVKTIKVRKSEVFAFVDSRNEKEIIYLGGSK